MTHIDIASDADKKKPVRVWVDGCFDMTHFGHANALRQAKELGDVLVVGIHNDDEVKKHKGPPVFDEDERYRMVAAMKWVDEIVTNVPYDVVVETLEKNNCDFCVHGDDISLTASGEDSFLNVKRADKYREVKRTQGISTTDIVGRMLLLTKTHRKQSGDDILDTTELDNMQKVGDKVVYVTGVFDCFHVGHLSFLEKAVELGDFLIVGIHNDQVVNKRLGSNYPIMNLLERILSVLACRHVDEVVIGAPYHVTVDLIDHFNVSVVAHDSSPIIADESGADPYQAAKNRGIFHLIENCNPLTTFDIINRIIENRDQYYQRNKIKEVKDLETQP